MLPEVTVYKPWQNYTEAYRLFDLIALDVSGHAMISAKYSYFQFILENILLSQPVKYNEDNEISENKLCLY